ncbi:MAG: hypothetical protein ACUVWP_05440 [bacterium]
MKLSLRFEWTEERVNRFKDRGVEFLFNPFNSPMINIMVDDKPAYTYGSGNGGMLFHTKDFSESVLEELVLLKLYRTSQWSAHYLLISWNKKIIELVSNYREYLILNKPELLDILRKRINIVKSNLETIFAYIYRSINKYKLIKWEFIDEEEIERKLKISYLFNMNEKYKDFLHSMIQSIEGELLYSRLSILEDISRRLQYAILLLTVIMEGIAIVDIFANESLTIFSKLIYAIFIAMVPLGFILFMLIRRLNIRKSAENIFLKHEKARLSSLLNSINSVLDSISQLGTPEKFEKILNELKDSKIIIESSLDRLKHK